MNSVMGLVFIILMYFFLNMDLVVAFSLLLMLLLGMQSKHNVVLLSSIPICFWPCFAHWWYGVNTQYWIESFHSNSSLEMNAFHLGLWVHWLIAHPNLWNDLRASLSAMSNLTFGQANSDTASQALSGNVSPSFLSLEIYTSNFAYHEILVQYCWLIVSISACWWSMYFLHHIFTQAYMSLNIMHVWHPHISLYQSNALLMCFGISFLKVFSENRTLPSPAIMPL